ncbi:MAG: SAF domain-containing protein, partial [Acidimicrobiales bacterium]
MTAAVVAHAGGRVAVLAVAREVPVGAVISAEDLTVARVAPDAGLSPVPARLEPTVVGQVAAVELRPGSLLTRGEVTSTTVPVAGQQLVGVRLRPGQMPARTVVAGMRVLVVATPGDFSGTSAGGESAPGSGVTIPAVVVDVSSPGSDGTTVVDLSVASAQGPQL